MKMRFERPPGNQRRAKAFGSSLCAPMQSTDLMPQRGRWRRATINKNNRFLLASDARSSSLQRSRARKQTPTVAARIQTAAADEARVVCTRRHVASCSAYGRLFASLARSECVGRMQKALSRRRQRCEPPRLATSGRKQNRRVAAAHNPASRRQRITATSNVSCARSLVRRALART